MVAIECCIGVANHLIASEGFRTPTTNADSLAVLVEQGILPPGDIDRFRDRLVHLHGDVDDEAVYAILQDGLADLDTFAAHVGRWMRGQP